MYFNALAFLFDVFLLLLLLYLLLLLLLLLLTKEIGGELKNTFRTCLDNNTIALFSGSKPVAKSGHTPRSNGCGSFGMQVGSNFPL